jgi:effector-binding domain-containing protein
MRNFLLAIPLLILAAVVFAVVNLGVFKSVVVEYGSAPEMIVVYKNHVGPYHKIGEAITPVEEWAKKQNVDCKQTFGEYFDNPQVQEQERLRSRGGCVVNQEPHSLPPDFGYEKIPSKTYYKAYFQGSPWIGPYKVYKQVYGKAEEDHKKITGAVIEIYELLEPNKMQTTYLFPAE